MTTTRPRPTPADPLPGVETIGRAPSGACRNLPPELGPDAIGVLEGRSFMFSNAAGDVPKGSIGGFVHDDTRFLDWWELRLNGAPLLVLSSATVDAYSAAFFLSNADLPDMPANSIGVRRLRFVGDGVHERVELQCYAEDVSTIELRLAVGTDFADLFEIKSAVRDRTREIVRSHAEDGSRLEFAYRHESYSAKVAVEANPPADRVEGDELVWELTLRRNERWQCELRVPLHCDGAVTEPLHRRFGEVFDGERDDPVTRWHNAKPRLRGDSELLRYVYAKSTADLVAMRIEKHIGNEPITLLAAGLPWFLTIFGRDTLITAYQMMTFGPELARGALVNLAAHQSTEFDDFRDQEPGKILHEYRTGELTKLGLKPHNPYFGAADTTQLWLIVLSEYWRWTRDDELVVRLRDNALAALRWIDEHGDLDGDGYVEYATRSSQGLGNQCWRDSWNGIQYADGTIPVLPIATCETQGYTYDAKLRLAELADGPLADAALARRLRDQAGELRERFNRDFWIDDRGGYYALGLDGDKRRIDPITSNMGHLLWSGIVPRERAGTVTRQLMSAELFSGWGVRTMSTAEQGYNPIGYHVGTVWPHDNSIIAHGLARYGFREEANRIITALLEAARYSEHRLPEAFSGYDQSFGRAPVPFPTACNPQAWASGAPLLFIRTMLGLEPRDGELVMDPQIPTEFGRIRLMNAHGFGRRWNLEASGTEFKVRPAA